MSLKSTKKTALIAVILVSLFAFQLIFSVSANEGNIANEEGLLYNQDRDYYKNYLLGCLNYTLEDYANFPQSAIPNAEKTIDAYYEYYNGMINDDEFNQIIEEVSNSPSWSYSIESSTDGYFQIFTSFTIGGVEAFKSEKPTSSLDSIACSVYNYNYWAAYEECRSNRVPAKVGSSFFLINVKWFNWRAQEKSTTFGLWVSLTDDDITAPTISLSPINNVNPLDSSSDSSRTLAWSISDQSGIYTSSINVLRNGIIYNTYSSTSGSFIIPRSEINVNYQLLVSATDNDNDRSGDRMSTSKTSGIMKVIDDDITPPSEINVYKGSNLWSNPESFYDYQNSISITADAIDLVSGIQEDNGIYVTSNSMNYYSDFIDENGDLNLNSNNLQLQSFTDYVELDATSDNLNTIGSTSFHTKYNDYAVEWWGDENPSHDFNGMGVFEYSIPIPNPIQVGYSIDSMYMTSILSSTTITMDLMADEWFTAYIFDYPVATDHGSVFSVAGDNRIKVYAKINSGSWNLIYNLDGNNENLRDMQTISFNLAGLIQGDDIQLKVEHSGIIDPSSYGRVKIGNWKESIVQNIRVSNQYTWDIYMPSAFNFPLIKNLNNLQSFDITALDADNDWVGDSMSLTKQYYYNVIDDDNHAPNIAITYFGDGTDQNAGYIYVNAYDLVEGDDSGLSSNPSGNYYLNKYLINEPQIFIFTATDNDNDRPNDALSTTKSISITLVDDDTSVLISSLSCETSIDTISIQFTDIDPSFIGSLDWLKVDGEIVSMSSIDIDIENRIWSISFTNDWIFELGSHSIQFQLSDNDNDRGLIDKSSATFNCNFVINEELLIEWIDAQLEQLIDMCIDCDCWTQKNHEKTMINKINEVIALKHAGLYFEAYNKLLHDIKPKLTGLKMDENGNTYGNGDFKNAWVCSDCFSNFETKINSILSGLNILF